MTLTLTPVRKQKMLLLCDEILSIPHVKIRKVSQLLGRFSSNFIAVPQWKLCYKSLDINKKSAIKTNEGNFDKFMILSKANVYWWKSNTMGFFTPILRPNPYIVLNIDASLAGWRASMAAIKKGTFLIWRISAAHECFRTQSCITRFFLINNPFLTLALKIV